jgi:hypothetical protein
LTEQEKADLVAYLDGELRGEAARAVEAKLSLNPSARAVADSLRRTWDLLDYLPRPEPSPSFTERTLSRLTPVQDFSKKWFDSPWMPKVLRGAGLAACLGLGAIGGCVGYRLLTPREPGEKELVRELRIIENKPYYDLVEDLDFVRQLDHPDLFGEEQPSR